MIMLQEIENIETEFFLKETNGNYGFENLITEIKNSPERLNSIFEQAEERISNIKNRLIM